jgi:hypothetical protein
MSKIAFLKPVQIEVYRCLAYNVVKWCNELSVWHFLSQKRFYLTNQRIYNAQSYTQQACSEDIFTSIDDDILLILVICGKIVSFVCLELKF